MQTLFFILGVMAGAGAVIFAIKHQQLRAELGRKYFEVGFLKQQVDVLETLLKETKTPEVKNEIQAG